MGPHAMSGNPTGKVGLADAPAVELALSRSKVYLLLSWGFLFPEEEEFYNYLQDGEFVEDGFSAVESLEKSFDAVKAAPAARDLIFPIRKLIEQIGEWEQENFKTWEFSDLQDEHRRGFSNKSNLKSPPPKTLFREEKLFKQSLTMGENKWEFKPIALGRGLDVPERLE